jgi:hypothetical protein
MRVAALDRKDDLAHRRLGKRAPLDLVSDAGAVDGEELVAVDQ